MLNIKKDLFPVFTALAAGSVYFTFFFNTPVPSFFLLLLTGYALWHYKKIDWKKWKQKDVILPGCWVIFYVILSLITGQFYDEWNFILRILPFLIIPLIITGYRYWSEKKLMFVYRFFVLMGVFVFLVALINAIIRQINAWPRLHHINWYFFYRYDFWEIFHQHPVYMSYFYLMALLLLFYKKNLFPGLWSYFIGFIIFFAILLSGSRIGYMFFIFFSLLFFLGEFKRQKDKKKWLYPLVVLVLFAIASFRVPIIKEQIYQTLGITYNYQYYARKKGEKGKLQKRKPLRPLLWKDSWEVIWQSPLKFNGRHRALKRLFEKYRQKKHDRFLQFGYNSHNIYLSLWLYGGPLWLLCYLALLGIFWMRGIRERDKLIILFALLWTVAGITETIFLSRGIIFFILFYSLLIVEIQMRSISYY